MTEEKNQNLNDFFQECYEKFSDAIFRYCYFQTSNREKALDFTQDAFVKTLEYLKDGNKVENIRAFLYKVARNLIIDERRRKKSESLDKMQESGFDIKDKVDELQVHENDFDIQKVLEVVDQLELKYREVIMLRYIEDMSVKEIASIIKDTENNVSVKIHRAIKRLTTLLDEEIK